MEIVGVFQEYFWRYSAEHDQEKSKIAVSISIIKLLSLKNPLKNSVFCDRSGTVRDNRPKFSNIQKTYKHQIFFDSRFCRGKAQRTIFKSQTKSNRLIIRVFFLCHGKLLFFIGLAPSARDYLFTKAVGERSVFKVYLKKENYL